MKIQNTNNIYLKLYFTLFIGLALVGQIINYSPIPEADFWSIFERIDQLNKQNWFVLWDQHNEHRVILTYLITYLDNKIFNNFFLNYFVIFLSFFGSAILIYKIFFELNKKNEITEIFFGLLVCLLFYWSQKPNFIFPFHVSIIWVNLFTLLAFYFYNHFSQTSKIKYLFLCIVFYTLHVFTRFRNFYLTFIASFSTIKKKIHRFNFAFLHIININIYLLY